MRATMNLLDIKLYLMSIFSLSIYQLLSETNLILVALSVTATVLYTFYKIYWGVIDRRRKNKAYHLEVAELRKEKNALKEDKKELKQDKINLKRKLNNGQ